jgi:hypothetical protein
MSVNASYSTLNASAQMRSADIVDITKEVERIDASKLDARSYPYNNKCGVIKASITIYRAHNDVKKIWIQA